MPLSKLSNASTPEHVQNHINIPAVSPLSKQHMSSSKQAKDDMRKPSLHTTIVDSRRTKYPQQCLPENIIWPYSITSHAKATEKCQKPKYEISFTKNLLEMAHKTQIRKLLHTNRALSLVYQWWLWSIFSGVNDPNLNVQDIRRQNVYTWIYPYLTMSEYPYHDKMCQSAWISPR